MQGIINKKNLSISLTKEKFLLINVDENHETIGSVKSNNFRANVLPLIKRLNPYLIIVTSQNSLSRTDNHFQHFFGEELIREYSLEEDGYEYKRLAKIDATKPIHSSSISSTFSKFFKKEDDPYNVRTRIYYHTGKVCLNFEDEELSKKSCFTNKKSVFNEYNSKSTEKSIQSCILQGSDITITNYFMKRYNHQNEKRSKTGTGIIAIGLIFKIKGDENSYKLIINNRCKNDTNVSKLTPSNTISIKSSSFYIVSSGSIIKNTKSYFNFNFKIKELQLSTDLRPIIK
jgi:hypothetical protein